MPERSAKERSRVDLISTAEFAPKRQSDRFIGVSYRENAFLIERQFIFCYERSTHALYVRGTSVRALWRFSPLYIDRKGKVS